MSPKLNMLRQFDLQSLLNDIKEALVDRYEDEEWQDLIELHCEPGWSSLSRGEIEQVVDLLRHIDPEDINEDTDLMQYLRDAGMVEVRVVEL